MQDVEDQWREKYSALEENHKEMLKLKGQMTQKIERLEIHKVAAEKQHKEMSERCKVLKDSVTLHYQTKQRALLARWNNGQEIQRLRQQVNSVRREMAEWAGTETAKEAANSKKKIEELKSKLAEALWRSEEAEAREIQLGE